MTVIKIPKIYDVEEWATHVLYWVNQKFKDRNRITWYTYHYVCQLMGVLWDRLKFGSTTALDCCTGQNKGRYCKKIALIATPLVAKYYWVPHVIRSATHYASIHLKIEIIGLLRYKARTLGHVEKLHNFVNARNARYWKQILISFSCCYWFPFHLKLNQSDIRPTHTHNFRELYST